ncbi:MAG: hypothetical protein HYT99_00710 [Candidatus Tectomicrobia bacterium]|nr:hypothetical protein [Candidatus Tectomicrobia bacterium]
MLDREVQHPAPQLETATQNRSPHLDAHADAFCLAYATYFNIEHPPVIERIRAAIDALPTTLTELQRLARRIQQRTGGPDIDRDGLRYFWAEYAKRMPRNA